MVKMSPPKTTLRLLLVEDAEGDASFLLKQLKRDGVSLERVDALEDLSAALEGVTRWDVIVADWSLSGFDALDALQLVREKDPDLPFIVVSANTGEERAVEVMKAGAQDYLPKSDLARLRAAIEREVAGAEERRERRRAEEKYRSIFENSVEGIFRTTLEGRFVTANPAMARILGYTSPEDLISSVTDVARQVYTDPRDRQKAAAFVESQGSASGLETRVLRKDGSAVWVSASARAVYDAEGNLAGFEGTLENITERKKAQEEIARLASFPKLDPNPIVETDAAGRPTYLNPAATNSFPDLLTLKQRHPLLTDVGSLSREIRASGRQPIMREVRVGEACYRQVISSVTESDLLRFYITDVTERRRAEDALRKREERFRSLVQNASDVTMILDADGAIRYTNPAVERILGFGLEKGAGTDAFARLHPDDADAVRSRFTQLLETPGGRLSAEYRMLDKTGSWRYFETLGTNLLHDPSIGGIVVNAHDVTERKRAEEALRESEARLRISVATAPVVVFGLNREGIFTLSEGKGLEALGIEPDRVVGRSVFDVFCGMPQSLKNVRRALAGEEMHSTVEVDGLVFATWYSPYRGQNGDVAGVYGIAIDFTERKEAREALRQSEELYGSVIEQAAENIFMVDVETKRILEANAAFHRSLGYEGEELRRLTLYDIVAHDHETIDYDTHSIVEQGQLSLGERTYRHKDGSLLDFEVNVSTITYDGRAAMCTVAHDVTQRKQAEESLRQSLSVLLSLREAGQILGSTLESEEIISRLLEIMKHVSNLTAAIISLKNSDGSVRVWRSAGLEGLRRRIRYAPEAEAARRAALETEEHRVFLLPQPGSEHGHLVGLCLPFRARDHVIGVLEAYGSESLAESETIEILDSLTSQAGSALENARLYGELAEREKRLHDLVGQLMGAQEEERRRVAYEVHDGLAQVASAAHQHLQAFSRRYPPESEKSRGDLERVLKLVRKTVSDARKIIANLRPTALDDLGLAATFSLEVENLREEGYRVDYEEELGEERLPAAVEITLFRAAQEALTNVRKHARAEQVCIELRRLGDQAYLEVWDNGRGFDPAKATVGTGPGERVGFAGMQERVNTLGGKLEIQSQLGAGTSIKVAVPLPARPGRG